MKTLDMESLATVTGGWSWRNISLGPLGSIHIATKAEVAAAKASAAQWRLEGLRQGVIR